MSLTSRILGAAGRDNALLITLHSGTASHRLLFDCGQGCSDELTRGEIRQIEHLFFSHFHIDHVAGFDGFFRVNCDRQEPPVNVWGPPGSLEILHHRARGFLWNLVHDGQPGEWYLHEVDGDQVRGGRLLAREGFSILHDEGTTPASGPLVDTAVYSVSCLALDHGTTSLGYRVLEKPRRKVRSEVLDALGLRGGPWLRPVLDLGADDDSLVEIEGRKQHLGELREKITEQVPGGSVAYLTDFMVPDDQELARVARWLDGVGTLVCESQYRHADAELAHRHRHMTSTRTAELACRARVGELLLFHVSERYPADEVAELVAEAKAVFPRTRLGTG